MSLFRHVTNINKIRTQETHNMSQSLWKPVCTSHSTHTSRVQKPHGAAASLLEAGGGPSPLLCRCGSQAFAKVPPGSPSRRRRGLRLSRSERPELPFNPQHGRAPPGCCFLASSLQTAGRPPQNQNAGTSRRTGHHAYSIPAPSAEADTQKVLNTFRKRTDEEATDRINGSRPHLEAS